MRKLALAVLLIVVGLFALSIYTNNVTKQEFKSNSQQILQSATDALERGSFGEVLRIAERYRSANDPKMILLGNKAEEGRLLNMLKGYPAYETQINRDLYSKLVELVPDNKRYQDKLAHYQGQLDERERSEKRRLETAERSKTRMVNARIIAEQSVLKRLKAPASAEFSLRKEVIPGGAENENIYTVTGHVDAQNGFGAQIRSQFRVVLEFEPNGTELYTIISVTLQ